MATARDTVYAALKRLAVTAAGETPTAAEAEDGLARLNAMMHGFAMEGGNVDWRDLALTDPMPTPQSQQRSIEYLLAVELAPEFGREVDPVLAVNAERARSLMLGHYATVPEVKLDPAVTPRDGVIGRYNILTDE